MRRRTRHGTSRGVEKDQIENTVPGRQSRDDLEVFENRSHICKGQTEDPHQEKIRFQPFDLFLNLMDVKPQANEHESNRNET
jgi:hypothetical protein